MSRVLKVMIALLAIAAIATPVMAEDRLGLAGQLRVRGWHIDNENINNVLGIDPDKTQTFADQRLRIGGKLSVAEGVSVTFRTDITESQWGTGSTFGSGRAGSTQQWDRAHLDLEKNNMHLRAGQQLIVLGNSGFDAQSNGLTFNLKGAIPFTLFYMLEDNNGSNFASDSFYAGARVGHGTDLYAANLFLVNQNDGMEEDVYVVGATVNFNLDAVKIATEIEYFFGDANDAMSIDATGLQGYVDASVAVDEAVTLGGQLFYADGADSDEFQYHVLGNGFNGWDPLLEVGTGLSNEVIAFGRPFVAAGVNAGIMGGRIYGMLKASDALSLGASVAYLEPEDDDNTLVDEILTLAGGVSYALMENTKLDLQLQYSDIDGTDLEEVFEAGVGLFVNF